jgi:hypothetical protein
LDNLIGWIMMTAAVLPVVLVLLLAWSGARRLVTFFRFEFGRVATRESVHANTAILSAPPDR